ncbi:MAG: sugar kinase [Marmoricola sp.]|nr:sugar kinase [Marmoricola sp.]
MIVVVGESLVDLTPGADGSIVETVGGSPLNVAVALGRLDVPALLITEVGNDERGEQIVRYVQASEIELIAAPSRGGRTSTARVRVIDGEPTYDLDVTWYLSGQELPDCDALHVGSLGTVLEPGRDSVLDLVEQAWALDVFVSYDPNVRAQVLIGQDQSWRDVESLADRAHLVKLSEHDIALLHPGADPDVIARSLLTGDRTELVILTRGARGATAYVDGLAVDVPAHPVTVVDTVGAGDAFMAATLAVLLESNAMGRYAGGVPHDEAALEHLLRAATEVAGLSCARQGAAAPRRSELRVGWPD